MDDHALAISEHEILEHRTQRHALHAVAHPEAQGGGLG
jgi:hypothetical protein